MQVHPFWLTDLHGDSQRARRPLVRIVRPTETRTNYCDTSHVSCLSGCPTTKLLANSDIFRRGRVSVSLCRTVSVPPSGVYALDPEVIRGPVSRDPDQGG